MTKKEKELATHHMKEADEALRSGHALMKIKDSRGAINRFYYAVFYVVQALLILKGKSARTHSGCLHLFREEFIRNGPLSEETNGILSSLFEGRMEEDYAALSEPSKDDAAAAEKSCKTFLKQAKELFDALI